MLISYLNMVNTFLSWSESTSTNRRRQIISELPAIFMSKQISNLITYLYVKWNKVLNVFIQLYSLFVIWVMTLQFFRENEILVTKLSL